MSSIMVRTTLPPEVYEEIKRGCLRINMLIIKGLKCLREHSNVDENISHIKKEYEYYINRIKESRKDISSLALQLIKCLEEKNLIDENTVILNHNISTWKKLCEAFKDI